MEIGTTFLKCNLTHEIFKYIIPLTQEFHFYACMQEIKFKKKKKRNKIQKALLALAKKNF